MHIWVIEVQEPGSLKWVPLDFCLKKRDAIARVGQEHEKFPADRFRVQKYVAEPAK